MIINIPLPPLREEEEEEDYGQQLKTAVNKKRELFPGQWPPSPGSLTLPYFIRVQVQEY
jgi:hypothetical protein